MKNYVVFPFEFKFEFNLIKFKFYFQILFPAIKFFNFPYPAGIVRLCGCEYAIFVRGGISRVDFQSLDTCMHQHLDIYIGNTLLLPCTVFLLSWSRLQFPIDVAAVVQQQNRWDRLA